MYYNAEQKVMIETKRLTKYFGDFQALKDVSFEIPQGEIVGFLGQNGAGKTTLMRILTSFLPASSGTVLIDGEDIAKQTLSIRRKIGYLPETPPLYPNMTVKEYLRFAAEIKDVPVKQLRSRLDKVLEECRLVDVKEKTIGTLSKGYKQRVGIAQAIIHEPKILILDEPTSGLDPIQILQVRSLIKSLRNERTVLLSTHILSEIEQIAQRVLIIRSGEIIVDKALEALLKAPGSKGPGGSTLEEVFIKCHKDTPEGRCE
jgi:ABC-2 type transport system ATP-binding protein